MNDIRRNELKEALDDFRARVSLRDKKLQEAEEQRVLSDDKAVDEMAYNILTGLLNDKFESIANYNSIIASIKDQEVIDILHEIVEEEYIHIGQLQKILLNKAPVENAEELVDQGSEEVETPVDESLTESLEDEEIHDRLKDFQGMELIAEIRKVAKEKKKDFKDLLKQEIVASEGEHAGEFRPDPDSDVYYLLNKNGAIEKFKGDKLIKTMIPQAFASDLEFAEIGKEKEKEA